MPAANGNSSLASACSVADVPVLKWTHVVSSAMLPLPPPKTWTLKLSSGPRLSLSAVTTPKRSQARNLPEAARRLTDVEPDSWETTQTWAISEGSCVSAAGSAGSADVELDDSAAGASGSGKGTTRERWASNCRQTRPRMISFHAGSSTYEDTYRDAARRIARRPDERRPSDLASDLGEDPVARLAALLFLLDSLGPPATLAL